MSMCLLTYWAFKTLGKKAGLVRRLTDFLRILESSGLMSMAWSSLTLDTDVMATKKTVFKVQSDKDTREGGSN